MDPRSALEALRILHREGTYAEYDDYGYTGRHIACCMTCPNTAGWPCETRQLIDQGLAEAPHEG